MNDQLECGNCGRHNIVDACDYVGGVKIPGARKCAICGCREIKIVRSDEFGVRSQKRDTPEPMQTFNSASPRQEETMATYPHARCTVCKTKKAVINGKCSKCFRHVHGITLAQYKHRLKAGETKEEILTKDPAAAPIKKTPSSRGGDRWEGGAPFMEDTSIFSADVLSIPQNAILIDFRGYKELLDKLDAMAKADFRSPAQQILYLISEASTIIEHARGLENN